MLLSVGAVGSMQEAYAPTHIVVPDQFIDRTRHRPDTFFGNGLVAHVSMADPVCPRLVDHLVTAGRADERDDAPAAAPTCVWSPPFSTRAESLLYRSWGVDVIGMTNLQEAKLAREAELCYATLAMITDYDCWRPHDAAVTADEILRVLGANARMGQEVVRQALSTLPAERTCTCGDALGMALVTAPELVPRQTLRDLALVAAPAVPEEG